MYQDRWYQTGAVDSLFEFYSKPRELDEQGVPVRKNALVCLPTGTGKSVVQARFFQRALDYFAATRAMSLTHNQDLIGQNEKKMRQIWPACPTGIYSAGLKRRDTVQPIIFGGIQSAVGKFPIFGSRDFLFIDECHLVGDDGSYLKIIHELMYGTPDYQAPVTRAMFEAAKLNPRTNPFLKVVGLSATHYRMKMGFLTNGPIFTDIVYNLCTLDGFNRLVAEGFLAPLISKPTNTVLSVEGVGLGSDGDFNQTKLQASVDKQEVTYQALCEFLTFANDPTNYRHCGMIFASGIEHADHINEILNNYFGVPSVVLHSKQTAAENEAAMTAFKTGKARFAVSMNKLTTGVDHPPIDIIGMFRPTMSTGLWVQMLGRGTRPYDFRNPGDVIAAAFPYVKSNCMVLDFAGNAARLGPINDPIIPRRKGEGPPGDAPLKICRAGSPPCNTHNHSSARFCVLCGSEFPIGMENIDRTASTAEVMKSDMPDIQMIPVDRMVMKSHLTAKGDRTIMVAYYCGRTTYHEQKSVETSSHWWKKKTRDWFRQVYQYDRAPLYTVAKVDYVEGVPSDVPNNNADIIELSSRGMLRPPKRLQIWMNANPQPEIQAYEF